MNGDDRETTRHAGADEKWSQTLNRRPPRASAPKFTGPESFWPPKVKGATNLRKIPWESPPGELTAALETNIRQAALGSKTVREALGQRYAYLSTHVIDPGKGIEHHCLDTQVTFFSYAHNQTVQVRMKRLSVEEVVSRGDYQPPEGVAEVRMAIDIARKDSRLSERTLSLTGKGILAYVPSGSPGAGHRVIHVTFTYPGDYFPACSAMVDLTDERVLSVRCPERR